MTTAGDETVGSETVSVTARTAQKARDVMEQEGLNPDDSGLRLYVQQGGCAGLSYGMRFEDEPADADKVFESNGLRIIVDPSSLRYVQDSLLDYQDGLQGEGFFVHNPNAEAECGCGESFHTQ